MGTHLEDRHGHLHALEVLRGVDSHGGRRGASHALLHVLQGRLLLLLPLPLLLLLQLVSHQLHARTRTHTHTHTHTHTQVYFGAQNM